MIEMSVHLIFFCKLKHPLSLIENKAQSLRGYNKQLCRIQSAIIADLQIDFLSGWLCYKFL